MKINLTELESGFKCHSHKICEIDCFLIIPQIDAEWSSSNLHQRSLVVDKSGTPLSSGFPKFFNLGEKPTCYPDPIKFTDWKIEEKVDGTLVICDFINGQFNMRTRGTVSYKSQENFQDFELLTTHYPKIVEFLKENSHLSLLFELITPNNIIVVRSNQVKFYFLGAINKNNLQLLSSEENLNIWRSIGCPSSPDQYSFEIVQDLQKIASVIKEWKGKEGIVLSYNKGQNKVKIKSDWYCWLHRIKTQLNTESNLIEYYIDSNMPSFEDFFKKIEKEFDYEIAKQLESEINKIVEKGNAVKSVVRNMKDFVASIRKFETRKQQAEHILLTYKASNRSQFVFSILDGKELTKEQLVKLMTLQNS